MSVEPEPDCFGPDPPPLLNTTHPQSLDLIQTKTCRRDRISFHGGTVSRCGMFFNRSITKQSPSTCMTSSLDHTADVIVLLRHSPPASPEVVASQVKKLQNINLVIFFRWRISQSDRRFVSSQNTVASQLRSEMRQKTRPSHERHFRGLNERGQEVPRPRGRHFGPFARDAAYPPAQRGNPLAWSLQHPHSYPGGEVCLTGQCRHALLLPFVRRLNIWRVAVETSTRVVCWWGPDQVGPGPVLARLDRNKLGPDEEVHLLTPNSIITWRVHDATWCVRNMFVLCEFPFVVVVLLSLELYCVRL